MPSHTSPLTIPKLVKENTLTLDQVKNDLSKLLK